MNLFDIIGLLILGLALIVSIAYVGALIIAGVAYLAEWLKSITWSCRTHKKGRYER